MEALIAVLFLFFYYSRKINSLQVLVDKSSKATDTGLLQSDDSREQRMSIIIALLITSVKQSPHFFVANCIL